MRGDYARWKSILLVFRVAGESSGGSAQSCHTHQRLRVSKFQLCLGVFATKNEAIEAYDDALCREAVKQRSSVLRMPKKR